MTEPASDDLTFDVPLVTEEEKGAWTYAALPRSGEFLGTRRSVKVTGHVDDVPFQATLLPMGDGVHMLPLKADLRRAVGKEAGERVAVRIDPPTS